MFTTENEGHAGHSTRLFELLSLTFSCTMEICSLYVLIII